MKLFTILSRTLLGGGIIVMLTACEKKDDKSNSPPKETQPYVKSLISSYIETPTSSDMISASTLGNFDDQPWSQIFLSLIPSSYDPIRFQPIQDKALQNDPEALKKAAKYDSLATAHNDLTYNRYTEFQISDCMYRRTSAIHVVSNTDYDAEHPAGTYLDDILLIRFTSAEDYLATGYSSRSTYLGKTTTAPLASTDYPSMNDFWLCENLAEFNKIQRKLIQFAFTFTLTKGPKQTGKHQFTFTYMNEDGIVLTTTTPRFIINP